MRCLIPTLLLGSALLTGAANAQYAQSYDRPYGDRDYARQDRALFDRVRADLDRASSYPYASRDDRKRFDEARRDLFDFQSRFEQGRYERHGLDKAISRIEKVVSHNSLDGRSRGALDEDLRTMRDYRAFREHKEYRDYEYGFQR
ncbi:MAG: hypothetical protein ABSB15_19595 [Bryobacteraceae bacterium]|jgi:hypothetical protein